MPCRSLCRAHNQRSERREAGVWSTLILHLPLRLHRDDRGCSPGNASNDVAYLDHPERNFA